MNYKLDSEEQNLVTSIEKDEWKSVQNFDQEKQRIQNISKNSLNKTKRITIRVTEADFQAAHVKAIEEGLAYQTLLSSIIHKYLTGRLRDQ
jgi:predicted DNA binding CopG/RHH family protein